MGQGNSTQASRPSPASIPAYCHPNQGQYDQASYPHPQNRNPTPAAVMDCDKAAERYGGLVISEHGKLKKPPLPQGWMPYTRTSY